MLALLLFASAGGRPSPIQDSSRVLVGLLALAVLCVWATSRRYVLVAFLEGAAIGKREITVLRLRRRIYFHGAKVDKSHQEVGVLSALTCEALRELEMRHPRYRLHVVAPVHDSTRRISKIIDGSTVQEARRRWESRAPVNAS